LDGSQAERGKKRSSETEEQTQHFGNGEDHLTMGNIEEKFFPHPLTPFLTSLGMTRWAESACLAGKHEETLLPTVWTPDAGKSTLRVAAVKILVHNLLDNGTKIAIISLKSVLIFQEKSIEAMKKHSIENSPFWMTLVIDPCHGRDRDSGNGPEQNLPDIPDILPLERILFYQCSLSKTVNNGR
jgi:hypothetical protein